MRTAETPQYKPWTLDKETDGLQKDGENELKSGVEPCEYHVKEYPKFPDFIREKKNICHRSNLLKQRIKIYRRVFETRFLQNQENSLRSEVSFFHKRPQRKQVYRKEIFFFVKIWRIQNHIRCLIWLTPTQSQLWSKTGVSGKGSGPRETRYAPKYST